MPSGVKITIQVYKGQQLQRTETLNQDIIKIGKLQTSHLQLDDDSVSRMHAVMEVNAAGEVTVVDLGSTKGTFVNRQRVNKARVNSGDEILVGDVRLVVTFSREESADETMQVSSGDLGPAPGGHRPTTMGVQLQGSLLQPTPPAPPPLHMPPPAPSYVPPPMAAAPPPYQARAAAPPALPQVPAHIAEQVEERDGSMAVEVSAMFEDAVLEVRHLDNPQGGKVTPATKGILGSAAVALFGLFLLFVISYAQAARQSREREAFDQTGRPSSEYTTTREGPWRDILAVLLIGYGFGALGFGLFRLFEERRENEFSIGPDPHATFHAPGDGLPAPRFPLVRSTGTDYELLFTLAMTGDVQVNGKTIPLSELSGSGQARPAAGLPGAYSVGIPQGARVNLRYSDNTYNVNSVPRPRRYPVPLAVDWAKQSYTGGTFLAVALFLLMIFSIPPDPKSLSLDAFLNDQRMAKFLIKPEEVKPDDIPDWLKKKTEEPAGGKRAKGDTGKMGDKKAPKQNTLVAVKAKDNMEPHLAKEAAKEAALNSGVLGILRNSNNSGLASIFGRDSAIGKDAEEAMGGLVGTEVGDAYGGGGAGVVGVGVGGGGTGEGTYGMGNLGTLGRGGGAGGNGKYGVGVGNLKSRKAGAPEVVPGTAEVRGSLDKELIRRIIRRHLNEVKFCYERELTRNPNLQGRVMIQFTIGGTGQVMASVVQQSTMGNPLVEQCIATAVRRWEFPKPQGGIVQVTYPFVLKAAGE